MDLPSGETSEFWKQFAGSGVANIFMVLAYGVFWGMKKLCSRDSKCKGHIHCCCLDMDVADRTLHEQPGSTDEAGPGFV